MSESLDILRPLGGDAHRFIELMALCAPPPEILETMGADLREVARFVVDHQTLLARWNERVDRRAQLEKAMLARAEDGFSAAERLAGRLMSSDAFLDSLAVALLDTARGLCARNSEGEDDTVLLRDLVHSALSYPAVAKKTDELGLTRYLQEIDWSEIADHELRIECDQLYIVENETSTPVLPLSERVSAGHWVLGTIGSARERRAEHTALRELIESASDAPRRHVLGVLRGLRDHGVEPTEGRDFGLWLVWIGLVMLITAAVLAITCGALDPEDPSYEDVCLAAGYLTLIGFLLILTAFGVRALSGHSGSINLAFVPYGGAAA